MEGIGAGKAYDIVKIAIQAGAIKLQGSSNGGDQSHLEEVARADAAYLLKLLDVIEKGTIAP